MGREIKTWGLINMVFPRFFLSPPGPPSLGTKEGWITELHTSFYRKSLKKTLLFLARTQGIEVEAYLTEIPSFFPFYPPGPSLRQTRTQAALLRRGQCTGTHRCEKDIFSLVRNLEKMLTCSEQYTEKSPILCSLSSLQFHLRGRCVMVQGK